MCVTNLIKRSSLWYNTRKQDATCSAIERISSDGNRFCSCSMLYEGGQKKNCMTWATHTWRYWINKYGGEDKWTEGRPHPEIYFYLSEGVYYNKCGGHGGRQSQQKHTQVEFREPAYLDCWAAERSLLPVNFLRKTRRTRNMRKALRAKDICFFSAPWPPFGFMAAAATTTSPRANGDEELINLS